MRHAHRRLVPLLLTLLAIGCSSATEAVVVSAVTVTAPATTIASGATTQLSAIALDKGGHALAGRNILWSSSNTNVATVTATGLVTAATIAGPTGTSVTITATSEGISGSTTLTVLPATVSAVTISPSSVSLRPSQSVQLNAFPVDAQTTPLTGRAVGWTSSDTSVLTVSASGLAFAKPYAGPANRSATVTASVEGRTGTLLVQVSASPVATVRITPASATRLPGQTVQLTVETLDAQGGTLTGRSIAWSSSDQSVGLVNANGVVTTASYFGGATRSATVTAASEGVTAGSTITVVPLPVASVQIAPVNATVALGATLQLTAQLRDSSANLLTGRQVLWLSADTAIARVTATGAMTAVGVGSASIQAVSEGRSAGLSFVVSASFRSCRALQLANPNASSGSYVLEPDGTAASRTTANCDMTTDGGGWTRIFGHAISNSVAREVPSAGLSAGLRLASLDSGMVSLVGLASYRSLTGFTEMRFECAKPNVGRRLHIKTSNSGVLDYLTGVSNVQPVAAGSYSVLSDDNSILAAQPTQWGATGTSYRVGKWGDGSAPRLTSHPMFIEGTAHWLLSSYRMECDDYLPLPTTAVNGRWGIYVR